MGRHTKIPGSKQQRKRAIPKLFNMKKLTGAALRRAVKIARERKMKSA